MASPIAHSIVGLTILLGIGDSRALRAHPWRWLVFVCFATCAADLDFVPGLVLGDPNRYHHGASHSLIAAVCFGGFALLAAPWLRVRQYMVFLLGTLTYASHIAVDALTADGRPPYGVPLYWPFSDLAIQSPWTPFSGVNHGNPGNSISHSLDRIFSWHNARIAVIEIALLSPLLGLSMIWFARRNRSRTDRWKSQ